MRVVINGAEDGSLGKEKSIRGQAAQRVIR